MVVTDNHSYAVQPRPHHPDEIIVWEMDERTLPREVIDGDSERNGNSLATSLHPCFKTLLLCSTLHAFVVTVHFYKHTSNPLSLHMHSLPYSLHSAHPSPSPHPVSPPPSLGVLCPIPIPPLDGDVSWSSREVGATLHYYCSEGFDLVGTASQECLPIGEWSSFTPLCRRGELMRGVECKWTSVTFLMHIYICVQEMVWTLQACVCAAPVMNGHDKLHAIKITFR